MFSSKIKVRKDLFDRIKLASEELRCASVDEFVGQVLEREVEVVLNKKTDDSVAKQGQRVQPTKEEVDKITAKLKGLGYIE